MIITLKPYFALPDSDDALVLARAGDTLIINGDALDLSALGEGDLIRDAGEIHQYLRGTITRAAGKAHVTLRLPVHRRSGHIDDLPPIIDPPDGPIAVPDLSGPEPAPEAETEEEE